MSDIQRMRQAQPAGARKSISLPPPALSEEARRQDAIDNTQFDKQAAEFSKPTTARPALIVASEIEQLRRTWDLGSTRLSTLRKVVDVREAVWQEMQGQAPFDVPSAADRGKADAFFAAHGIRLADEPRKAPDNPLKPKPAAAAAEPASMAAAITPGVHAQSLPASAPPPEIAGAVKGAVPLPPLASLEIHYQSAQGFECTLKLAAPSTNLVLESGQAAMTKLLQQNAKPMPAATMAATIPAAAGAPAAGLASGEPPKCKYHGGLMKESKKPGVFFCPKKMPDGVSYCDYKVGE